MKRAMSWMMVGVCALGTHAGGAVYDVVTYGATPDDAADDTVAIQSALDAAASAGGGVVKVPAGLYIAADLKIADGVSIRGEGRGVSILSLASSASTGKAILANADKTGGNSLIGIYNLSFDGNKSNQVNTTHGIRMQNVQEVIIAGCEFYDANYYGAFLDEGTGLVMQNCYAFNNVKSGFQIVDQTDMRLIGCEALYNGTSGFVINYTSWSTLTACHAVENSDRGYYLGSVDNMSISGCRATGNGDDGFSTWAPGANCAYLTFNGVSSGSNSGNGFDLGGIQNSTVNHCHAMSNTLNGVSISTAAGKEVTKSLSWQGGVISGNAQHGVLVEGAQQCILGGAVICDNSAGSTGSYDGVRITSGGVDSERIKIAGCVIRNTQTNLVQNYAVHAPSGADQIYVYTSDVTDNLQTNPIYIVATSWDTDLNQGE